MKNWKEVTDYRDVISNEKALEFAYDCNYAIAESIDYDTNESEFALFQEGIHSDTLLTKGDAKYIEEVLLDQLAELEGEE